MQFYLTEPVELSNYGAEVYIHAQRSLDVAALRTRSRLGASFTVKVQCTYRVVFLSIMTKLYIVHARIRISELKHKARRTYIGAFFFFTIYTSLAQ